MFTQAKNTKQQGNIGIGIAIAYFTQKLYTVSLPLNDSQDYDLVVDDGKLHKVQVKTCSFKTKNGSYEVLLKTCGGNQSFHSIKHFDSSKIDFVFIVTDDGDKYLIPGVELLNNKSSITLGKKWEKYKI